MANATAELKTLDVEMDCLAPGCEGKGYIAHPNIRIDPDHMKVHLTHAYQKLNGERGMVGADCDCPRIIGTPTHGPCYACKGIGRIHVVLNVPRAGQKVKVKEEDVLEAIFGDNPPEAYGIVFDTQTPEEHNMELRSGLGVRVTWDKLTGKHKIPKGKQIELWLFDLLELEVVR